MSRMPCAAVASAASNIGGAVAELNVTLHNEQ
jgi:hypothetical protein